MKEGKEKKFKFDSLHFVMNSLAFQYHTAGNIKTWNL